MAVSIHCSIDVPDLPAGLRFYGAVLGFAELARSFPTMAGLDADNATLCLNERAAGSAPAPGSDDQRR